MHPRAIAAGLKTNEMTANPVFDEPTIRACALSAE
jgi:hypothetical protein